MGETGCAQGKYRVSEKSSIFYSCPFKSPESHDVHSEAQNSPYLPLRCLVAMIYHVTLLESLRSSPRHLKIDIPVLPRCHPERNLVSDIFIPVRT